MIAFGPVPSRRLGSSIGIDTLPAKVCTYGCRYCQAGATLRREVEPQTWCTPAEVAREVEARLARLADRGEEVHVLTLVPDGEPTLDADLGATIVALRRFGLPVAVITNGSLLDRPEVRERLREADWVSVKVDAATPSAWHRLNRPDPRLRLERIRDGARVFASSFEGELATETMLVEGANDGEDEVTRIAADVAALGPRRAFLAVPTRPCAVPGTRPASDAALARAYALFRERIADVELLVGYEGDAFGSTGELVADLLAAITVHPMREDQVRALVARSGGEAEDVERLVAAGRLRRVPFGAHVFYVRPVPRRDPGTNAGT